MTKIKAILLTGLALASIAAPAEAKEAACAQTGPSSPLELHTAWILEGWELREGDPKFVFKQEMDRYYDLENPAGVFYDNFAPNGAPTFDNVAEYGANSGGACEQFRTIRHALTGHNAQIVGDTVASTTLGFVGDITRHSGERITFDARSQLGWQCDAGEWVIRHELNSAWVVEPEAVAPFFQQTGGQQ